VAVEGAGVVVVLGVQTPGVDVTGGPLGGFLL
jgi:hypothetical protein